MVASSARGARALVVAALIIVSLIAPSGIGAPARAHAQTQSSTLYVSPTGLDTNSGTTAGAPFRTIQDAAGQAGASGLPRRVTPSSAVSLGHGGVLRLAVEAAQVRPPR